MPTALGVLAVVIGLASGAGAIVTSQQALPIEGNCDFLGYLALTVVAIAVVGLLFRFSWSTTRDRKSRVGCWLAAVGVLLTVIASLLWLILQVGCNFFTMM